jgi:hypothetical protein
MLPFFVLETRPRSVFALFVNENTGTVFDAQRLELADDATLPYSEWVTVFDGSNEGVTFDGLDVNTGIVILVASDDPNPSVGGSLAQICGQSPVNRKLACYGTGSAGLSFIHGYSGTYTGSISSPQVRQVEVGAVGCPATDHSAPYFTLNGGAGCTGVVSAVLDFGAISGDPRLHPHCVRVPGWSWSGGGPDPSRGVWTRTVSLPTGSGRQVISIPQGTSGPRNGTQCGNPGQQPHSWGPFNKVSAVYVANAASGPVEYLKLLGTGLPHSNSIETTATYSYTVTVGLSKPLAIANWNDDPLLLRDTTGPSQYQTWDCDPGNTREEFINGCRTPYSLNYDDYDGDNDREWRDITCATARPTPPPDCVWTDQGMSVGQFRDGVVARWRSNTDPALGQVPCYRNNWPQSQAQADVFFRDFAYVGDPRYVTLLVTREYAPGPGRELIPVKYWAGFYVTGWTHHHVQAPACPDNDPPPPGASTNASMWGYWVNAVQFTSPEIEPSDRLCEFGDDPSHCVAVLVE